VREHAQLPRGRLEITQPLPGGAKILRPKTQPVHAGIHLEPQRKRPRAAKLLQQLDLLELVHHQIKFQRRGLRHLACIKHALEQHDAPLQSSFAQRHRLFQSRDRKRVGIGQRQRGRHQSVTVGIGLDHRHHAAARRAGAHRLKIGAQRGAVDARANQPRHRNTPSA
jgi:hypothetical protein